MGKATDPTQPEHIAPQIDLVGDLGPSPDVFDDIAFKANKPDYSGWTRNDLELALQHAVDELCVLAARRRGRFGSSPQADRCRDRALHRHVRRRRCVR